MADLAALWATNGLSIAGGLLIGFAFGSVPFGYLLVRLRTGGDVRHSGSGNIGATNVSRALGVGGGLVTLVLDAAKGAFGVAGAAYIGVTVLRIEQAAWPAAGALGAVLGHCYTPWLGGRGGKGVATLLGAFGMLTPVPTAIGAVVLGAIAAATRMMSAGSLAGTIALVVATWWTGAPTATVVAATGALAVVVWRHRENIGRLTRGEEARLGGTKA